MCPLSDAERGTRPMHKPFSTILLMLASVLVMLGSPGAAQTLRIGLQEDPDRLDPAQGGTFVGRIVFAALCDKLIDVDARLAYQPQLASAWAWSQDGRALTLT